MNRPKRSQENSVVRGSLSAGEHEGHVGHHLVELYGVYVGLLQSETHSKLMDLNLTQWRILTLIRFNADQTQRLLSQTVGIDPSSMTPIIDLFERKRWVRRIKSPSNRSAYGIRMTASGLKAYAQIDRGIKDLEKRITAHLGEPNRNKLCELLCRLHQGLVSS
jgi:DNA-binding MarR family transcriptional regulator